MSGAGSFSSLYTIYSEAEMAESSFSEWWITIRTSGVLLLAIAGTALLPLPCAFEQVGIPAGTAMLLVIGLANDYTTVLMVRHAARLGVSSFEEAVLGAAGRRGLVVARISLVMLLFGSLCGNLAAIPETAGRALELAGYEWLATSPTLLLCGATAAVLPISLLSLGEMAGISLFGVGTMLAMTFYLIYVCVMWGVKPEAFEMRLTLPSLPEAASTIGFAFYVQPCVLPLLRDLPPGDAGARVLTRATHICFGVSTFVYLTVGICGFASLGRSTPQDVFQGFDGKVGAALSCLATIYLVFCFAPILVPLRETLVRLGQGITRGSTSVLPPNSQALLRELSHHVELHGTTNALVTGAIISAVLLVAASLPNASAQLFSLTGATGVCMVAYVLPAWTHLTAAPRARRAVELEKPHLPGSQRNRQRELGSATLVAVVGLGVLVSALALVAILQRWLGDEPGYCVAPS